MSTGRGSFPSLIRSLLVLTAVLLASTGFVSTASASTAIRYVALGDSYSSGVGAGQYYPESGDCLRSPNAYPVLWARAHDVTSFTFAACSGARTSDVLANQVDALSAATTLVTITIGGNDAGFADVMITCVFSLNQGCVERVERAKHFIRTVLPARLVNLYNELQRLAPNARIIVLGYPRLYELGGSCWVGLSETKRAAINSAADALAEVTAKAAANAGVRFVDMREPFDGHEICSYGRWWLHSVNLFNLVESYHPTAAGQSLGYLPALTAVTG